MSTKGFIKKSSALAICFCKGGDYKYLFLFFRSSMPKKPAKNSFWHCPIPS